MEAQDRRSVGARPFWKQQNGDAGRERLSHLPRDSFCTGAALAIDEYGSACAGAPAKNRPSLYVAAGDEDAGCGGGVRQNVEVAEMV